MITAKLKDGFELEIPDEAMNNTELIADVIELDNGNSLKMVPIARRFLGKEKQDLLYEHLRREDGIVPYDAFCRAMTELLQSFQAGKNSSASPT